MFLNIRAGHWLAVGICCHGQQHGGRVFKVMCSIVQPVIFLNYYSCLANKGHFGACQQLVQTRLVVRSTHYLMQLASYSSSTQLPQEKQKYTYIFSFVHSTRSSPFFGLSPTGPTTHFFFCHTHKQQKIKGARGLNYEPSLLCQRTKPTQLACNYDRNSPILEFYTKSHQFL